MYKINVKEKYLLRDTKVLMATLIYRIFDWHSYYPLFNLVISLVFNWMKKSIFPSILIMCLCMGVWVPAGSPGACITGSCQTSNKGARLEIKPRFSGSAS